MAIDPIQSPSELEPLQTYRVIPPDAEDMTIQLTGKTETAAYGVNPVTGDRIVLKPLDQYLDRVEIIPQRE